MANLNPTKVGEKTSSSSLNKECARIYLREKITTVYTKVTIFKKLGPHAFNLCKMGEIPLIKEFAGLCKKGVIDVEGANYMDFVEYYLGDFLSMCKFAKKRRLELESVGLSLNMACDFWKYWLGMGDEDWMKDSNFYNTKVVMTPPKVETREVIGSDVRDTKQITKTCGLTVSLGSVEIHKEKAKIKFVPESKPLTAEVPIVSHRYYEVNEGRWGPTPYILDMFKRLALSLSFSQLSNLVDYKWFSMTVNNYIKKGNLTEDSHSYVLELWSMALYAYSYREMIGDEKFMFGGMGMVAWDKMRKDDWIIGSFPRNDTMDSYTFGLDIDDRFLNKNHIFGNYDIVAIRRIASNIPREAPIHVQIIKTHSAAKYHRDYVPPPPPATDSSIDDSEDEEDYNDLYDNDSNNPSTDDEDWFGNAQAMEIDDNKEVIAAIQPVYQIIEENTKEEIEEIIKTGTLSDNNVIEQLQELEVARWSQGLPVENPFGSFVPTDKVTSFTEIPNTVINTYVSSQVSYEMEGLNKERSDYYKSHLIDDRTNGGYLSPNSDFLVIQSNIKSYFLKDSQMPSEVDKLPACGIYVPKDNGAQVIVTIPEEEVESQYYGDIDDDPLCAPRYLSGGQSYWENYVNAGGGDLPRLITSFQFTGNQLVDVTFQFGEGDGFYFGYKEVKLEFRNVKYACTGRTMGLKFEPPDLDLLYYYILACGNRPPDLLAATVA